MNTWHYIWGIMRYLPGLLAVNCLAVLLSFLSNQVPGLMTREFFNLITEEAPARFGFWTILALVLASGLGRATASLGLVLSNVPYRYTAAPLLQKNMLRQILRRPGAAALPESSGQAVSRFRGDTHTLCSYPLGLNDLVGGLVNGAIAVAVMLSINAYITLFALGPVFLVVFLVYAVRNRIERYRRASREATGQVTGFIAEIFGAVQSIKVAAAERNVIGHFRHMNRRRSETALRDHLFDRLLVSVFYNAVNLSTGAILLVAGQAMREGHFTVGDFALFVFYLPALAEMTWMMGSRLARYKQTGVSVERMNKLMEGAPAGSLVEHGPVHLHGDEPPIDKPARHPQDLLETLAVQDLTHIYPSSGRGIEAVDLRLERGSFTVITGRIGSGKTTLLRALLGLLPIDRGSIHWNGEAVHDPATFFVPPRAAYTPQVPWLFSGPLRDNLLMGLPLTDDELDGALNAAVLEDDLKNLQDGLNTVVGPKGVRLSGGQMQRVATARMFVRNPELMVFDDLSSALDVETEQVLWQRLFARRDTTCLVVTHRRAALRRADRIIVFQEGKVEDSGSLDELLERSPEMRRLWRGEVE
ncbi:MAG: ATP-binding cassette domain-containing protein [Candidatus Latescibacteria bacterium]|nr:ATP-binding cassette domain-containing protein [Candidatus Latescibacterota bacterium]